MDIREHIDAIEKATKTWLNPDNNALRQAIFKTVEEDLFGYEDIQFQLDVIRNSVENGDIETWIGRAGLSDKKNAVRKKVLCLHAGNLPLVGFQTAIGVILSGADYHGKLSRKDPYLLKSFFDEINKAGLDQSIEYSTELSDFEKLEADSVAFAGSESSVPAVKDEISSISAAKSNAKFIIRTAKFSIAYLDKWNEEIMEELTEAMLRYSGKGCRSVALVVADFSLNKVREELRASIRKFWKDNPPFQNPTPELQYQYAYNESIQRNQLWMEDFLIQETDELPESDFAVNWVKGDENKARELRMQFGDLVQTVYTNGTEIEGLETEDLKLAQRPPLYWKPDGVDVMEELI